MRRRSSMSSRFTLIELLVVVAIISVLAAMLLPALSKVRNRARDTTCMNNQKQQAMALQMFADEHEDWVPGAYLNVAGDGIAQLVRMAGPHPDKTGDYPAIAQSTLMREGYLVEPLTYACPATLGYTDKYLNSRSYLVHKWNSIFHYRYNLELTGTDHDADYLPYWAGQTTFPQKVGAVKYSDTTMLLVDGVHTADYADRAGQVTLDYRRSFYGSAVHGGTTRAIMAYVDGHVAFVSAYQVSYESGTSGTVYTAKLPSD